MLLQSHLKVLVLFAFAMCVDVLCIDDCAAEDPDSQRVVAQRLVTQRPESGHYVETESGSFMVPYQARIAGTDITFAMVPVPSSEPKGLQSSLIKPFWIGKYEVTLEEYQEYRKIYEVFRRLERAGKREVTLENEISAVSAPTPVYDPRYRFEYAMDKDSQIDNQFPAVSMSQFAARQYTKWLSLIGDTQYRLPSEVEWEHACRAGTKTTWSFGNDSSMAARFAHFDNGGPLRVGMLEPNAWGIHDMHGNVSEWVVQRRTLRDGAALFGKNPKPWDRDVFVDDREAAFKLWILKGGDWSKPISQCRTTIRESASEELWEHDPEFPPSPTWIASREASRVGFRIVSSLFPLPRKEVEKYWGPDTDYLADSEHMNLEGGRGMRGLVDKQLPAAAKEILKEKKRRP